MATSDDLREWLELSSQSDEEESEGDGLGLCMIVKNEAKLIERCLMSVRPVISHWTIVDTGSTDGTQEIIRNSKILRGIPGELHERTWRDFASNRNEALELATGKTSHVLVIDADDILELASSFQPLNIKEDAYTLTVVHGDFTHARVHVFRPELFRYVGVLHEVLLPETSDRRIQTMRIRIVGGGSRSMGSRKYARDAELLQRALEQEPENSYLARRYVFHLAQSWRDAYLESKDKDHLALALETYKKRATMGGHSEEVVLAIIEASYVRNLLSEDLRWQEIRLRELREIHVISTGFATLNKRRERCLASVAEQRGVKAIHHVIDAAGQSPQKNKLENLYNIVSRLDSMAVVVEVDLDDELAHPESLRIISDIYDDPDVWLTYGSYAFSSDPSSRVADGGWYEDPTRCRLEPWRASHLKTYRAGLFQSVPVDEWKPNGEWAYFVCDLITMFPMLERAGKAHVRYVPHVLYLYHREVSHEHNAAFVQQGLVEADRVRARPRLPPLERLTS